MIVVTILPANTRIVLPRVLFVQLGALDENCKACCSASVLHSNPPGAGLLQCSTAQVGNGGYNTDPGFPCKTPKRCHLQHYLPCSDLLHQQLSFPPLFSNFCPDLFNTVFTFFKPFPCSMTFRQLMGAPF